MKSLRPLILFCGYVLFAACSPVAAQQQAGAAPENQPKTIVCRQGFVWRDAFAGDVVCVTPQTRIEAAADNAATGRIRDDGRCFQGFVWRDAGPNDHVCVTPWTRSEAAADNSQNHSRILLQTSSSSPDTLPELPAQLAANEGPALEVNCEGLSFRDRRMKVAELEIVNAELDQRPLPGGLLGQALWRFRMAGQEKNKAQILKCRTGPPPLLPDYQPPATTLDEKRLRYFALLSADERRGRIQEDQNQLRQTREFLKKNCVAGSENKDFFNQGVCTDREYAIHDLTREIELLRRAPPAAPGDQP